MPFKCRRKAVTSLSPFYMNSSPHKKSFANGEMFKRLRDGEQSKSEGYIYLVLGVNVMTFILYLVTVSKKEKDHNE